MHRKIASGPGRRRKRRPSNRPLLRPRFGGNARRAHDDDQPCARHGRRRPEPVPGGRCASHRERIRRPVDPERAGHVRLRGSHPLFRRLDAGCERPQPDHLHRPGKSLRRRGAGRGLGEPFESPGRAWPGQSHLPHKRPLVQRGRMVRHGRRGHRQPTVRRHRRHCRGSGRDGGERRDDHVPGG